MDELNVPELTNNPNLNRVEDLEKEDFKKEEKVIMDIDIIAFDEEMSKLEALYSKILVHVSIDIAGLNKTTYENNKINNLGKKASEILQCGLSMFDETKFNKQKLIKKQDLEFQIDMQLYAIFLKQLSILRELSISHFKAATVNEDVPADFAFFTADSFFVREAEDSIRPGSTWSYKDERLNVHNAIREISSRRKQLISERIQHSETSANAFQYLQMQQAQVQAIQQQQFGGSAGSWNIGGAYRPPDSNLNISLGYQQGRTNIQISMVPDEQASLLGPNGFTAGVGPANLGISLNLNL